MAFVNAGYIGGEYGGEYQDAGYSGGYGGEIQASHGGDEEHHVSVNLIPK